VCVGVTHLAGEDLVSDDEAGRRGHRAKDRSNRRVDQRWRGAAQVRRRSPR
jgi:hypothetical protein